MTKKALGLSEFISLSEDQQLDTLRHDGVYVGKRIVATQTVVLFQLYGFYVEIFYKQYRKRIDQIKTAATIEMLQPYIDQVNVRDLKNEGDKT